MYHIRTETLKVSVWFSQFTFPYLCKYGSMVRWCYFQPKSPSGYSEQILLTNQ